MNKWLAGALVIVAILFGGFFALNSYIYEQKQATATADYKDAEFFIEGQRVRLDDTTRYFGNDLKTDLDGDGTDDIAFIVTQQPGGSGTFYYVVAAVQKVDGSYVGSDGYFLGDRIAPQNIVVSQNPRHKNVIVVNYADRAPGEPMTAQPSVGKSVYLKLDSNMRWGIVEPNFEGEAR
jgi:hypothetical protein